ARFYCVDPAAAEGEGNEAAVLRELTRGPTVRELITLHRTFAYPMYVRLADLLTRGLIRADRRQSVRPVSDAELDGRGLMQAADGRASGGDRVGALGLARKAIEVAPRDRKVRHRHDTLERELFGELARGLLGEYRVPHLLKSRADIEKLNLS